MNMIVHPPYTKEETRRWQDILDAVVAADKQKKLLAAMNTVGIEVEDEPTAL